MYMIVGFKHADLIRWEIHPEMLSASAIRSKIYTYVKPLIKVNSCFISPPCDLAVSFALRHPVRIDFIVKKPEMLLLKFFG